MSRPLLAGLLATTACSAIATAAVRVSDDVLVLTNGGLGDVYTEVTQGLAELGAKRLADVRKQARVQV